MDNLIKDLIAFRDARNWSKHHTEPELARALMIEGAELNRLYLWGQTPTTNRLAEEVADNLIYCLYLCEKRGLNPKQIIRDKMALNAVKYPAGCGDVWK